MQWTKSNDKPVEDSENNNISTYEKGPEIRQFTLEEEHRIRILKTENESFSLIGLIQDGLTATHKTGHYK